MRHAFIFSVSLLSAVLVLPGCAEHGAAQEAAAPPAPVLQGTQLQFPAGHPQLAQLGLATVAAAQPMAIDLPAKLVWNEDRTQRIQPAFAGRIERILVDVGQRVRPGTPLAQLASPEFGAAQADAAKARADLALSQKALQRLRELHEAGVAARKDLEQAEADAARAQAELQRAEGRTHLYGGGVGVDQRLALSAGMAGVVVERNLNPGQELRADGAAPALFVISDPSSLWVQIDARESELASLRPGMGFELRVAALPGEVFLGKVVVVGDAIDPASRMVKVRGLIDNAQRRLKAEMLGQARITREPGQALVIPAAALQLRGSTHWVMLQVAPGAFEPREVQVGWLGPQEIGITGGLTKGEQVVTSNLLLLSRQYALARENSAPAAAAAPGAAR